MEIAYRVDTLCFVEQVSMSVPYGVSSILVSLYKAGYNKSPFKYIL